MLYYLCIIKNVYIYHDKIPISYHFEMFGFKWTVNITFVTAVTRRMASRSHDVYSTFPQCAVLVFYDLASIWFLSNISRIQVWEWRLRTYASCTVYLVFVSSLGGTSAVLRYYCTVTLSGMNVLFIRPSDVTNSEHKLRQFSNSLTFYFRILGFICEPYV